MRLHMFVNKMFLNPIYFSSITQRAQGYTHVLESMDVGIFGHEVEETGEPGLS